MSVIAFRGRDPVSEARALLNCVLKDGDVVGTDDTGRTALLLVLDPWTLDRLLAFDADAADLEDPDGESDPVLEIVPPKRGRRAAWGVQAVAVALLLVTAPYAVTRADQAPVGGAAAHVDRADAATVLPRVPEGPTLWRRVHQR